LALGTDGHGGGGVLRRDDRRGLATPAGAEIIYAHGGRPGAVLVAMNDDGSGAHVLLTPAQIPGSPMMINLAEPNVFPGGSTLAFQAETGAFIQVNGPAGDCGVNCAATYTLSGGAVNRLGGPPTASPLASSGEHFPVVTADGRVISELLSFTYACGATCSLTASQHELIVRPIGGGATQPWIANEFQQSPFSADPANGGLLAYIVAFSPNLLGVVNQENTGHLAIITVSHANAPAFSPDGSKIAYVDGEPTSEGAGAGLYMVAAAEGAEPKEVLADSAPPQILLRSGLLPPAHLGRCEHRLQRRRRWHTEHLQPRSALPH
jgi:WD40-like Beta Propeller Repeat